MEQANSTITITTDAYAPAQIADRVCKIGLAKVTTPVPTMIALAVLTGAKSQHEVQHGNGHEQRTVEEDHIERD